MSIRHGCSTITDLRSYQPLGLNGELKFRMKENPADSDHPIRVVLFCGGPTIDFAVARFINRLEEHPEVEFLGGFCESPGEGLRVVLHDLWKRRRWVGFGLFFVHLADRFNTIGDRAATGNLRLTLVTHLHSPEILAQVKSMAPELGLVYGAPILKPELFEIPTFGTLGIHHGKVPEYRGKKTAFWAMYNGEEQAGVTIQRISSALDRGDVVRKGEVLIGRKSLGRVWTELEGLGLDLFIEAILDVKRGTLRQTPQNPAKGRLYKDPLLTDILKFYWRQLGKRFRAKKYV